MSPGSSKKRNFAEQTRTRTTLFIFVDPKYKKKIIFLDSLEELTRIEMMGVAQR